MNENLYKFISFPENYTSINVCVSDLKNINVLKKSIPVYNSLFILNENDELKIHPKFGKKDEFNQLITLFPKFAVCLPIEFYFKNIKLGEFDGFIHSLFFIIDGKYKDSLLNNEDFEKTKSLKTNFIFKEMPSLDTILPIFKSSNITLFFPFYLLENPNSIKKQINILKLTEPAKIKIGFYPKEICQSFTDPRKYHLLFTLLSSLPFSLLLLNGQETIRNYPSALVNQPKDVNINQLPNQGFLNWFIETRDILQHYRNVIQKYRCPSIFLKKKVIWLEYLSLNNDFKFKIGFNFEKLFIRVSQPRIYQLKTIWYNNQGAHIDQSGIKKHLAPFGIALLDNFNNNLTH